MAASNITTTSTEYQEDWTDLDNDHLTAIPMASEDPMFGLSAAFRGDASPRKVDLGVGAYRDENLEPFVLPVVKKVGAVDDAKHSVSFVNS